MELLVGLLAWCRQHLLAGACPRHAIYVHLLRCVHRLQILQKVLEAGVTQSFWQMGRLSFGSLDPP